MVDQFYLHVVKALYGIDLYKLVGEKGEGSDRLAQLARRVNELDPPTPDFALAISELTGLHFDFRVQVLPALEAILPTMQPRNNGKINLQSLSLPGDARNHYKLLVDQEKAFPLIHVNGEEESMYEYLKKISTQFSMLIREKLSHEADRQTAVLTGALTLFEDAARAGTAEDEFITIANAYRHEFWPEIFKNLGGDSARIRAVKTRSNELQDAIRRLSNEINTAVEPN